MSVEDEKKAVGRRLRWARFAFNYPSSGDWAEYVGINRSTYLDYESGRNLIPPFEARKIWAKTGVTTDWLYIGEPARDSMRKHVSDQLDTVDPDNLPTPKAPTRGANADPHRSAIRLRRRG